MEFTPRLTAPSLTDPNYYSTKNIFTACGYGMENGNCTAYSHGRFMEECGADSFCRGNAGGWIEEALKKGKYEVSMTPALGAIAVWKIPNTKDSGHASIVEQILARADILTSNSAYKGTVFYLQTFKAAQKYAWRSNITGKKYEFQGFILPPVVFDDPKATFITSAAVQFRRDPKSPKNRLENIPKGATFMYDGKFEIVNGIKWMRGVYDSELGWVSGLYLKEVA